VNLRGWMVTTVSDQCLLHCKAQENLQILQTSAGLSKPHAHQGKLVSPQLTPGHSPRRSNGTAVLVCDFVFVLNCVFPRVSHCLLPLFVPNPWITYTPIGYQQSSCPRWALHHQM